MTLPTGASARRVARGLLLFLVIGFCVANTVNAVRKGGDFQGFLEAGRRILSGTPLYAGSSPGSGVTWPPFLAVLFVPLAMLDAHSALAARLVWYIVGLLCLGLGLWFWSRAYYGPRSGSFDERDGVIVAVLCILFPLQTNFEHQNLNPLLLFLLGLSALAVVRCRHVTGGVLLGTAVAIKAFPALLIVYLSYRRMWRAAGAAVGSAVALTVVAALRYGDAAVAQLGDWWRISGGGWPTRGNNQSLVAAVDRMVTGFAGSRTAVSDERVTIVITGFAALILVVLFVGATRRSPRDTRTVVGEFAMVTTLAVLFSPIAWDHYWVLLFPAFLLAYEETRSRPWARAVFWIAAFLSTALTPLTLGRDVFDSVRARSPQTVAALIIFVLIAVTVNTPRRPAAATPRS